MVLVNKNRKWQTKFLPVFFFFSIFTMNHHNLRFLGKGRKDKKKILWIGVVKFPYINKSMKTVDPI